MFVQPPPNPAGLRLSRCRWLPVAMVCVAAGTLAPSPGPAGLSEEVEAASRIPAARHGLVPTWRLVAVPRF
jgi:hypothetical protein